MGKSLPLDIEHLIRVQIQILSIIRTRVTIEIIKSEGRSKTIQFPMTYSELLPQLIQNHQIAPVLLEPFQWYDPNARCDYHAGAIGHSTENFTAGKIGFRP